KKYWESIGDMLSEFLTLGLGVVALTTIVFWFVCAPVIRREITMYKVVPNQEWQCIDTQPNSHYKGQLFGCTIVFVAIVSYLIFAWYYWFMDFSVFDPSKLDNFQGAWIAFLFYSATQCALITAF